MPLLILFVFVVFAEIATFIAVGRAIGVLATLALVFAAMIGGMMLVKVLGIDALRRAEASLASGESPAGAVFDAACVAFAGVLFALPGFLSDILAIMLLIRPLRRWLGGSLWRGLQASPNVRMWKHSSGATVVEGDFVEVIENQPRLPQRPPQRPGEQ
jgi:UPF0716 protein FxsA